MNLAFSSIHINVVLGRGWVTISMWHFFACVPLSTFSRGLVRHPCMLYMMTKGRQALWQALEGWELLAPNGGLRASLENFRRSFAGVLARSRLLSCMQIVHLAHRHWGSMRPCPVGHRASKKYQSSACLKIQKGSLSVQPMFWCQLSWYQYHYLDWIFRGGEPFRSSRWPPEILDALRYRGSHSEGADEISKVYCLLQIDPGNCQRYGKSMKIISLWVVRVCVHGFNYACFTVESRWK